MGVYAETNGDNITVEAVIASLDGKRLLRDKITGNASDAAELGIHIAESLLDKGGLAIMQEIGLLKD